MKHTLGILSIFYTLLPFLHVKEAMNMAYTHSFFASVFNSDLTGWKKLLHATNPFSLVTFQEVRPIPSFIYPLITSLDISYATITTWIYKLKEFINLDTVVLSGEYLKLSTDLNQYVLPNMLFREIGTKDKIKTLVLKNSSWSTHYFNSIHSNMLPKTIKIVRCMDVSIPNIISIYPSPHVIALDTSAYTFRGEAAYLPNLKYLLSTGPRCAISDNTEDEPWANESLTLVRINTIEVVLVEDTMSCLSPALERSVILLRCIANTTTSFSQQFARVTMPNLRNLEVSIQQTLDVASIFTEWSQVIDEKKTPNLKTITIVVFVRARKLLALGGEGIINTFKIGSVIINVHAVRVPIGMSLLMAQYTDDAFRHISPFGTKDQVLRSIM